MSILGACETSCCFKDCREENLSHTFLSCGFPCFKFPATNNGEPRLFIKLCFIDLAFLYVIKYIPKKPWAWQALLAHGGLCKSFLPINNWSSMQNSHQRIWDSVPGTAFDSYAEVRCFNWLYPGRAGIFSLYCSSWKVSSPGLCGLSILQNTCLLY